MIKNLFKKSKYITISTTSFEEKEAEQKPNIPSGMWVKCDGCGKIIYKDDLDSNMKVCIQCGYHFRLAAGERINQIVDAGTYIEFDANMKSQNPLSFSGYDKKINAAMNNSGLNEAVVTGCGSIGGERAVVCVMDSNFMMGSMGSVVGEKVARAIEKATEMRLPIIIFTASGGARMQEGIVSLMQMAKVSGALARFNEAGLLYITVLTDPTTGGVTASFAMLGDIIISEPNALIGFAGRRVIEQTIKQALPEGFQKAEFLLQKGFVDSIVPRRHLKDALSKILMLHKEI
jgi:acetyl-CoA carboxylase carboxyl transferase subunit beta